MLRKAYALHWGVAFIPECFTKMMKINSDGSVQTVTSSIVFQAFKELNDKQKQSFINMMNEELMKGEKIDLSALSGYGGYLKRGFK